MPTMASCVRPIVLLLLLLHLFHSSSLVSSSSTYREPVPPPLADDDTGEAYDDDDLLGRVITETYGTDDIEQPWVPIVTHSITSVDLMFVIDGSGSVNYYKPTNFNRIKSWIKRVASAFDLSTTLMRMGVMQYSHYYPRMSLRRQKYIRTEVKLGQCGSKGCFDRAVDNMKYMGFTTYTGAAIRKATTIEMRKTDKDDDKLRVILLLTDGPSSDDVKKVAKDARDKGYTFVSVGVGNYSRDELRTIATGDLSDPTNTLELRSFNGLPASATRVQRMIRGLFDDPTCTPLIAPLSGGNLTCSDANRIGSTCAFDCGAGDLVMVGGTSAVTCQPDPILGASWSDVPSVCGVCKAIFDMNIILDSSSSIGDKDFLIMKNFLLRLVDTYKIGPHEAQISLMRYNKAVYDLWDYNTYDNKADLLQAIYDIDYNGGGTFTSKALEYAVVHKFRPDTGIRARVPHITMVITDGKTQDPANLPVVTEMLKLNSQVIAIGIIDADLDEIKLISSNPEEYAFNVENSFTELLDITQKLSKAICESQDDFVRVECPADMMLAPSDCYDMLCDDKFEDPTMAHGIGTTCKARCCPGSKLIGNDTVTCQYNGQWTQPTYECVELQCPPIEQTVGLDFICSDDTKIGSQCDMVCSGTFQIIEPPMTDHCVVGSDGSVQMCQSMCVLDGITGEPVWTHPPVMCQGRTECDSQPCLNGGECTNLPGDFQCSCPEGFFGKMCEVNFDECFTEPCLNGGLCVDGDNDYRCVCRPGYYGRNCELVTDNCDSDPCQHGASCSNAENDYTCTCTDGFEGKDCDVPKVCKEQFDVLFIMDSSSSMGIGNFELIKNFVKALVMSLAVGRDNVQVALMKFNSEPTEIWDYNTHHSQRRMFEAVNDIEYSGSGTLTGKALRYALENYVLSTNKGRRPGVPHVTVLLSDGKAQDDVHQVAAELKKLSKIVVLAVGENHEADEIQAIASAPVSLYGKKLNNFEDLSDLQLLMGYKLCTVYQDSEMTVCPLLTPAQTCESLMCTEENSVGSECTKFCCPGYKVNSPNPMTKCQYDGSWSQDLTCVEIDECESSPCKHNGTCIDQLNGHMCLCQPGYVGDNCETDEDNCAFNLCMNGAQCVDKVNKFECECAPGYSGLLCEINDDDCASAPCLNQARCVDGVASFTCECLDGFQGVTCETAVCGADTCANGGTCTASEQGIVCDCAKFYEGDRCQTKIDPCRGDPCQNGAQCVEDMLEMFGFKCLCLEGFEGMLCENEVDPCENHPCQHESTCVADDSAQFGFQCLCPEGYEGLFCETKTDPCDAAPCQRGTCVADPAQSIGFQCLCPQGFEGMLCETEIDECASNPCQNEGACVEAAPGTYMCLCKTGYEGDNCETMVDLCALTKPCQNGATCVPMPNNFLCQCAPGWQGATCEDDVDECLSPMTCNDNQECINTNGGHQCACKPGWTGVDCETDIDECQVAPCENGGQCIDGIDSFTCVCADGFTGQFCLIDIDECASAPCQNGGTCIDKVNAYKCQCPMGFGGADCEVPLSLCGLQNPCMNGGVCKDTIADGQMAFECECAENFAGAMCENTFCPKDLRTESVCTGDGSPGTTCSLNCPPGQIPIQQAAGISARNVVTRRVCLPEGRWTGPSDSQWGCVAAQCESIVETPLDTLRPDYDLNAIRSVDIGIDTYEVVTTTQAPTTTTTPKPFVLPTETGPQKVTCTNDNAIGSRCTHSCSDGYTLQGSLERDCSVSGAWTGQKARCVRTSCGVPKAEQILAQVCTNSDKPGSLCYIQCPAGMSIFGSPYKQCNYNFDWFPATPWGCAKTQCDKPLPVVANGKIRCDNGNQAKSSCRVTCDPGYTLLGQSQLTCAYRGLDLDWRGNLNFVCIKLPCSKSIDLRTGETTGFGKMNDYVMLALAPHRTLQDNRWDMYSRGAPCNMKSVLAVKRSTAARVKVDLWYDSFPSLSHFDLADSVNINRFNYARDRVLGYGNSLITNMPMRVRNQTGDGYQQGSRTPGYFTPLMHSTFYLGGGYVDYNNNQGVQGRIGPSSLLGNVNDGRDLYVGLNREVNSYRVGSGLCLVCINED